MLQACAFALVGAVTVLAVSRGLRWWVRGLASAGLALILGVGVWAAIENSPSPVETVVPAALADRHGGGQWASSRACKACHPSEYETWHRSYHRTMTQVASPAAIVAPWQGSLEKDGRTYQLRRDGDRFMVEMPAVGTTGEQAEDRVTRPVVMVTGSHHLQLYWVPLPWADAEASPSDAAAFEARCATCHVDEGAAAALAERGLTPIEVEQALDSAAHAQVVLSATERIKALRHARRIQVRGRLQQFPFGWFIREERWVHEDDTFLQPPPDATTVEHWEQTWSEACDQCHSVAGTAEWTADGGPTNASVTEFGIACEACHGPAAEHVAHHRNPVARYAARASATSAQHIVNPARLSADRATAVCAQCHGEVVRMQDHGVPFPVGEPLEPWGRMVPHMQPPFPAWLQPTLKADPMLMSSAFWADGTMRVAGRDANAMMASACATEGGLTCISCHDMHGGSVDDQLKTGGRGDAVCAECHPAVAAAGSEHTHHPAESDGSRCMNCHMPHTTLGLLTAMRSHRIDSPDAMRAHATGRPDACTLCHVDKPLAWSAEALHEWFGHERPETGGDDRSAAVDGLLRGDGAQRAVYAWHLGWEPALRASGREWVPGVLSRALDDPYSGVRAIAGQSLKAHPEYAEIAYDYTAPSSARQAVMTAVYGKWNATSHQDNPAVLVGPEGLDEQTVGLLQLVRDDRPVVVSE